jgi:hypothetical protein
MVPSRSSAKAWPISPPACSPTLSFTTIADECSDTTVACAPRPKTPCGTEGRG